MRCRRWLEATPRPDSPCKVCDRPQTCPVQRHELRATELGQTLRLWAAAQNPRELLSRPVVVPPPDPYRLHRIDDPLTWAETLADPNWSDPVLGAVAADGLTRALGLPIADEFGGTFLPGRRALRVALFLPLVRRAQALARDPYLRWSNPTQVVTTPGLHRTLRSTISLLHACHGLLKDPAETIAALRDACLAASELCDERLPEHLLANAEGFLQRELDAQG